LDLGEDYSDDPDDVVDEEASVVEEKVVA